MKTIHKKTYSADEDATRFEIFKTTLAEIEAHNKLFAVGKATYTRGTNKFSDNTHQENEALNGALPPP